MTRDEYLNSTLYRMVFILSGFRRLTCTMGLEFINDLKKIRWKNNKSTIYMTKDFMIGVDLGFEILDAEEVRAYSDYICNVMKYPEKKKQIFYNNLLDYAEHMDDKIDFSTAGAGAMVQARAMVYLDELIK